MSKDRIKTGDIVMGGAFLGAGVGMVCGIAFSTALAAFMFVFGAGLMMDNSLREPKKQPEKKKENTEAAATAKEEPVVSEAQKTMMAQKQKIRSDADEFIKKIHKYNDTIKDEEISKDLDEIEKLVKFIYDRAVNENSPETVARFSNYYVPTMLKLLHSYTELLKMPVDTPQTQKSMEEIADMVEHTRAAFREFYDELMVKEALDISSEIDAMRKVMELDGLANSRIVLPEKLKGKQ